MYTGTDHTRNVDGILVTKHGMKARFMGLCSNARGLTHLIEWMMVTMRGYPAD